MRKNWFSDLLLLGQGKMNIRPVLQPRSFKVIPPSRRLLYRQFFRPVAVSESGCQLKKYKTRSILGGKVSQIKRKLNPNDISQNTEASLSKDTEYRVNKSDPKSNNESISKQSKQAARVGKALRRHDRAQSKLRHLVTKESRLRKKLRELKHKQDADWLKYKRIAKRLKKLKVEELKLNLTFSRIESQANCIIYPI